MYKMALAYLPKEKKPIIVFGYYFWKRKFLNSLLLSTAVLCQNCRHDYHWKQLFDDYRTGISKTSRSMETRSALPPSFKTKCWRSLNNKGIGGRGIGGQRGICRSLISGWTGRLSRKNIKDIYFYFKKVTLTFQILFTADEFSPFSKLLHHKNSEKSLCSALKVPNKGTVPQRLTPSCTCSLAGYKRQPLISIFPVLSDNCTCLLAAAL